MALAIVTSVTPVLAQSRAQDTSRTSRDSLAARLERAEEAIAALKQQVADAGASGVQSKSRLAVELNGRVLMNGFYNSKRVNNVDVPTFVKSDSGGPLPLGGMGFAIRQTTLGLSVTAPDVLGGSFIGGLDVDFFGGQQPSSGGRTFPLIRMRVAKATLKWPNAEIMVGQDAPLMSMLNPVSLASVGVPDFTAAGNLWLWLPQVRVGVNTSGDVRFGVQGAVLAPTSGDAAGAFDTDNDLAERSKRPFVEGRASVSWGSDEMAGSIGVSAHDGWYATSATTIVQGQAWGADAKIPLSRQLEVRGEWYTGDGMRSLGGGAVGQLLGVSNTPIHSTGAWAQVNVMPTTRITLGGGYGFDDPDDGDLPAGSRTKNTAMEAHLHLRPAGPLLVGFEWRRIQTEYRVTTIANDHLNVAIGFGF